MSTLHYVGWQGNQNIGDDAVFCATRQLLDDVTVTPDPAEASSAPVLFGGGTVLPVALKPFSDYDFDSEQRLFALGVGINDPAFYNRRLQWFDLRWAVGRMGFGPLLSSPGICAGLLRKCISITGHPPLYFQDQDFRHMNQIPFELLGVRGPRSHRILEQYELKSQTIADPALYLEPDHYSNERSNKIAICVRSSGLKWTSSSDYVDVLVDVCREWPRPVEFVTLPFYPEDQADNQQIADRIPSATCKNYVEPMDLAGLMNDISSCDVMIGEKLHANVLAAACHVPFVSLEYRPKNLDFAESMDLEEMNIRLDEVTHRRLRTTLHRALNDPEIRDTLVENVQLSRTKLEAQSNKIRRRMPSA